MNMKWLITLCCLAFLVACERKPEDLEAWRNAEGGFEKLTEWAQSPQEPQPVRVRAVQILIEEHQPNALQPLFEGIEDPAVRASLVDGVLPTVTSMWEKRDWPEIDKSAGGLVKVEGISHAISAKDSAFFLQPHAQGDAKTKLEAMLAEWMSDDQDIRNQLGVVGLGPIAARAGDAGIENLLKWLRETKEPSVVVDRVMTAARELGADDISAALAAAVRERCEAEHPDLLPQTEVALLKMDHENIIPYVERAIQDPESPAKLIDGAMDVYARIMKERAGPLLAKLVTERTGLIRWVSATRLIEVRGRAGALAAANALPLEVDSYTVPTEDAFKKESEIFCNFVNSELTEQDVDPKPVAQQFLASPRWPVQVLGVQCAKTTGASNLKENVLAFSKDKTAIPGWGEPKTLGELATEIAADL